MVSKFHLAFHTPNFLVQNNTGWTEQNKFPPARKNSEFSVKILTSLTVIFPAAPKNRASRFLQF